MPCSSASVGIGRSYGKYEGCRYSSKEARRQFDTNRGCKLIHERAVPKNLVIDRLLQLDDASPAKVREILDELLIGVVVTPDEDARLNANKLRSRMPREFDDPAHVDYQNPLLRYKVCMIEIDMPPKSVVAQSGSSG
jgi:hypothetical protein